MGNQHSFLTTSKYQIWLLRPLAGSHQIVGQKMLSSSKSLLWRVVLWIQKFLYWRLKPCSTTHSHYLRIGNTNWGQVLINQTLALGYKFHTCCHFQASTWKYRQYSHKVNMITNNDSSETFNIVWFLRLCSQSRTKMLTLFSLVKLNVFQNKINELLKDNYMI